MVDNKNPIDLRYPHLIPERIKQYALDIFDTVQKYPAVNPTTQKLRILLDKAEIVLRVGGRKSPFFKKIRRNKEKNEELEKLIEKHEKEKAAGQGDSQNYAFFKLYYTGNKLTSPIYGLREILGDEVDILPEDYEFSLDDIKQETRLNEIHSQGKGNDIFYYCNSGRDDTLCTYSDTKRYKLFNHDLLYNFNDRYSLRPVFIVERFLAANDLEDEIRNGEVDYHYSILQKLFGLRYIEGLQVRANGTIYTNVPYRNGDIFGIIENEIVNVTRHHHFSILRERLGSYGGIRPIGDAVVVAPVGGYTIPEYTEWRNFRNRDIYIFKFGERNPKIYLTQLLAVTSSVVRDNEEDENDTDITQRIKYVVLAEKRGIQIKNNDLKFWDIKDLFIEAKDYGCDIPGYLKKRFDRYFRYKTRHASPYLIEPFLRRKSWMLLTGEEGTGKSYMGMALSAAIATHGKLCFPDWRIRQRNKAKVLYIADNEMTNDIIRERMSVLRKLYRGCEKNLIIKTVKDNNLSEEYGQKIIQKFIDEEKDSPVEVLVLDHLLKLSDAEGDKKDPWKKIRAWVEGLNEAGLTVILLHHEYAGSKMLGSRLLAADAPARVHLDVDKGGDEDPKDKHIIPFKVQIIKNRGGWTEHKARRVWLYIGGHPQWSLPDENKDAPGEPKHSGSMSRKRSKSAPYDKVLELRSKCYRNGKPKYSNAEIARMLGCSKSSVEKTVKTFPPELKRR